MRCFCIGCIEISQRFTIVIKKTKKEVGDIALSRWPPMLPKAKLARDLPSVLGLGVELIKTVDVAMWPVCSSHVFRWSVCVLLMPFGLGMR